MSTTPLTRPFIRRNSGDDGEFNNERIRQLRQELNMTQESFAHEIGVTFATVNRWENGRTIPNKVAQKVLRLLEKKMRKMKKT
ncbi:helix-turn-helix transcriptional regulator [candidate division KSB1 bacterium]|nr:helix-turn-helix transcriptional regulator [candidate division KSB1 bacterium]